MARNSHHGTRPAEARSLKVKDVDLVNNSILIRRTFSTEVLQERTKQHRQNLISLHPDCVDYIRSVVSSSLPEGFLFTNKRTGGKPYTEWNLTYLWHKSCKLAGIPKIKLYHASRHSFASQLVNSGVEISVISKMLGHSNISVTEKYAHVNLESQKVAGRKLSLKK